MIMMNPKTRATQNLRPNERVKRVILEEAGWFALDEETDTILDADTRELPKRVPATSLPPAIATRPVPQPEIPPLPVVVPVEIEEAEVTPDATDTKEEMPEPAGGERQAGSVKKGRPKKQQSAWIGNLAETDDDVNVE